MTAKVFTDPKYQDFTGTGFRLLHKHTHYIVLDKHTFGRNVMFPNVQLIQKNCCRHSFSSEKTSSGELIKLLKFLIVMSYGVLH